MAAGNSKTGTVRTSVGRRPRRHAMLLAGAVVAASLVTAGSAHAASSNWIATPSDATWANAANWNLGNVPGATAGTTNADTATFNQSLTNSFGTAANPVVIDAGRNVQNVTFDTAAASPYVIGTTGGNALLLTSGGTTQTTSTVANAQTVNAPLVIEPASATTAGTYTLSGNAAGAANTLNVGGPLTLGTTSAQDTLFLAGTNAGANTFSGTIDSSGSTAGLLINKTGAGAWTFGGNGTSTLAKSQLQVNGGTFNFGSATDAPTLTQNGNITGGSNVGVFVVSGNFNMVAGTLNSNGTQQGLVLNATNTYTQTGGTFSTNGLIEFANSGGTSTVNISGGALTTTNATVNATNLAVRGTATVNLSGSGVFTTPTLNMSTSQLSSGTATSTFNLNGGTLATGTIIKGTGGPTGTQTFNFNGGTLKASASSTTFMTGLTNAFVKSNGAVIDTQAFNDTIGQNLLTDAVSTGGGLTKRGAGTLTLGGANTYTGESRVEAGTLALTSAGTIDASSAVNVLGGATFDASAKTAGYTVNGLKGAGTVKGLSGQAVTVGNSGTIAPGDGGVGTLTVSAGNIGLASGDAYNYEVGGTTAATTSDLVNLTDPASTVTGLSGNSFTLNLANLGTVDPTGKTFVLFDYAGVNPADAGNWTINYGTTGWSGGQVSVDPANTRIVLSGVTSVPEPGIATAALVALGLLGLMGRRRAATADAATRAVRSSGE